MIGNGRNECSPMPSMFVRREFASIVAAMVMHGGARQGLQGAGGLMQTGLVRVLMRVGVSTAASAFGEHAPVGSSRRCDPARAGGAAVRLPSLENTQRAPPIASR
jgi:hypothetical protein